MSQVKVKGPKVKVKYSKLAIYATSFGSSNHIIFKPGRYIKAPEHILQCENYDPGHVIKGHGQVLKVGHFHLQGWQFQ